MEALEKTLQRVARLTAILYNESCTNGDCAGFEVVLFPNGEDPTLAPHDLPPLTSKEAIRNLTEMQKRAYYQGYYPGGYDQNEERTARICEAIGIRL
ncbi:hypothetical protein P691DRAFT_812221 [Macrolepiota fuliginosa MF-IS2]|uniref:Mug135-like C-terminal domain-containing protein n=1 Tax=Macrolepiota fuliginosa MF-IS2 TaxID=1400762 RepID=A0A9P6C5U2_9AGAR|nr:hypothetical protein P691DRAFT_812221 [Macrolepiota fuliginosa MF-IS2]